MVLGLVDFVGYIYRVGPKLMVNFSQQASSEYGCRNKNLGAYNNDANYKSILEIAAK